MLIELPRISDQRGSLTCLEGRSDLPFDIARAYYLYDVPAGETRAGHAHLELGQLLVAVAGSFSVIVDDGVHRSRFALNRPWWGLYIPPLIWREIEDFSSGAVCLALASARYDETDYIREYDAFLDDARRRGV